MAPIKDYAVLGDGRSAALVSKAGAIDWLCWPRFDSPAIFGALLDARAGQWLRTAPEATHIERRYLPGTAVLETRMHAPTGVLVLTDVMPVNGEEFARRTLVPDHELLRAARCESGEVELLERFAPRPRFGEERPRFRDANHFGIRVACKDGALLLNSDVKLRDAGDGVLEGRRRLRAGEQSIASLVFSVNLPAVLPALGEAARARIEESVRWWREWVAQMDYHGPARTMVERSAITLKLLTYAPSGAIVAAPTTSLPEHLGADLNWDYRFCWLRDAALTARALFGLGFHEEARAFVGWLVHTTRLTRPRLRVLYDVHGNSPGPERDLDLTGYDGSRPVRIGNAAEHQLQLDTYGEVVNAVATFARAGNRLDHDTSRMLREFGAFVCEHALDPDQGIWEPREPPRDHTHSRLMCWSALDQLIELADEGVLKDAPRELYAWHRERLRRDILENAWNPRIDSYVGDYGGDRLDASTLLLSWYGFHDPRHPRMRATFERLHQRLGAGNGLLYRTSGPIREGAFGVCCFWSAEHLAIGGGTLEEAKSHFAGLLGYANDVGLFAEEIDPASGDALGNFPQGFTHIGLVNAALSLDEREREGWDA